MAERISRATRIKGAVYGLAVCDALGGPVEFKTRGSFPPVTTMLPNYNFGLPSGCFTDDTSMALCLAHSLLESDGQHNMLDQVQKYISWWRRGYMSSTGTCFDIGVATSSALGTWDRILTLGREDHPSSSEGRADDIAKEIVSKFAKEKYCGNGSLMRVLPTALISLTVSQAVELAGHSSLPTHPHPRCADACMLYASLVSHALGGVSKAELALRFGESIHPKPDSDPVTPIEPVLVERLGRYQTLGDWERTPAKSIRSTGYVVDTLEASLWAFFTSITFEDAAIRAVNLGDDSDTVGAICGGLAGAYFGFEAIPDHWLNEMRKTELIEEVVEKLVHFTHKMS